MSRSRWPIHFLRIGASGRAISESDRTRQFWREAFTIRHSVLPQVSRRVMVFTGWAFFVCALNQALLHVDLGIEVAPYEVAGGALGLLLVLRTNGGYDRWWEARKLWGSITNQCRNLTIEILAYGPDDRVWRDQMVRWTAAFAHVTRHSLRGQRTMPNVVALLGADAAHRVAAEDHMPDFVALRLAELLHEGYDRLGMDRFAFLRAENTRADLVDSLGGCERIVKSPLPAAYAIFIRQFLLVFLVMLPFALLPKIDWLTPLVTLLVSYAFLALDDLGMELQNPFDLGNVGHLPLDQICATIERNVFALLADKTGLPVDGDELSAPHA